MSNEQKEHGRNSLSVVARLMGLEALPPQRLAEDCCRHYTSTGKAMQRHPLKKTFYLEKMRLCGVVQPLHAHVDEGGECRDVYEDCKMKPSNFSNLNDGSSEKRMMALVEQKFLEAKQLARNPNLPESKEFQVLSSHNDMYVKFLEETNLQFSKYLCENEKPIKPSTANAKQLKKQEEFVYEVNGWDKKKLTQSSGSGCSKSGSSSQPRRRIVVLKPSSLRKLDLSELETFPAKDEHLLCKKHAIIDQTKGSREVAKEITQHMRESFCRDRKDDFFLFSSRQSSDYSRRLIRTSSPESSSVLREARKRMSERLAMATSNVVNQEQEKLQRSNSTLGELLAVFETVKDKGMDEEFIPDVGDYDLKNRDENKSRKFSIKGKLSGFFSWKKKSTEKSSTSPLPSLPPDGDPSKNNVLFNCVSQCQPEESPTLTTKSQRSIYERDAGGCSSQSHDNGALELHHESSSDLKIHPTEEKEMLDFAKSLLSSSGFDNETASSALIKWHSIESPLNPLLMSKEDDAKCRFLFDSVNLAILEITQIEECNACLHQSTRTCLRPYEQIPPTLTEQVLQRVTSWFSASVSDHCGNNTDMIVNCIVNKYIYGRTGREWEKMMCSEIMEMEREIERQVLEELMADATDGFTSTDSGGAHG